MLLSYEKKRVKQKISPNEKKKNGDYAFRMREGLCVTISAGRSEVIHTKQLL